MEEIDKNKYDIEIDYLEGLKLISENKDLILERECKEDYNGKARLFFDKNGSVLQEAKFVFEDDDYEWRHIETGHVFDASIEKLILSSHYIENAIALINNAYNYSLKDWNDVYEYVVDRNKNVLDYLVSVYYCTNIRDIEDKIEVDKFDTIKEIVEAKIYD